MSFLQNKTIEFEERKMKKRKLVIIGNGFDRFHGIPSSYWDFKKYLCEKGYYAFVETLENYIDSDELWSDFESELAQLDYERVKDDNSCYMLSYSDDEWRDSAHHDYQYMIRKDLSFSADIPVFLKEWILSLDTKRKRRIGREIINNENMFLNFNYTDTLENTYGINGANIVHIHGNALETEKLIVGHGNEELTKDNIQREFSSEEEENAYFEYISGFDVRELEGEKIIRGYFVDTYKDVNKIMMTNQGVLENYRGIKDVYVLGHSVEYVDLPYFERINNILGEDVSWTVTFYGDGEEKKIRKTLMSIGISRDRIHMCKMEQLCKNPC